MTNSDKAAGFSIRRIRKLWIYYSPIFRRQLLIYLSVSAFLTMLLLLPFGRAWQMGIFTIAWSIIPYMYELAPLVLTRNGNTARIIERMIPASAVEKYVFFMVYFVVAIGIVCYALPETAMMIYTGSPAIQTKPVLGLVMMRYSLPLLLVMINCVTLVASTLTCFYVVMRARTHRVLKGIVSVFMVQLLLGLLGSIYGMVFAFKKGIQEGMAGVEKYDFNNVDGFYRGIIDCMNSSSNILLITLCLILIFTGIIAYKSYCVIHKRNL